MNFCREIALKKGPKKNESLSQPIKMESSTPINPLPIRASAPVPNYQQALISAHNPFDLLQSQPFRPITSQPKTSPYYDIASYTLYYIKPELQSIPMAHLIAQQFFPPNFHYISGH